MPDELFEKILGLIFGSPIARLFMSVALAEEWWFERDSREFGWVDLGGEG